MTIEVNLAGEGRNDLGGWFDNPPYRASTPATGVIEALVTRAQPGGWKVTGARVWKKIRKYQSGDHRKPETRNVMGAALEAVEHGAQVVIFSRDRDRDEEREEHVEAGIVQACAAFPTLRIAGGVAIEALEAWLLLMKGDARAEEYSRPQDVLSENETEAMVAIVEQWVVAPGDTSLHRWIDRVRTVLSEADGRIASPSTAR